MKLLVLGAGFQGTACVLDCLNAAEVTSVTVADQQADALKRLELRFAGHANRAKLSTQQVDLSDAQVALAVMQPHDVVISAVPYFFNRTLMPIAIEAQCHWVDMGGNTDLVLEQMTHSPKAQAAGVTMVPDMGLAPGFANVLAAELIESMETVESVQIRVGGLPQDPQPPLNYALFFSIEGLINEYIGDCLVLRQGRCQSVPSLTEVETLSFPAPVGDCEAFHTLGGSSTMPMTYEGRVQSLDYKTVRYPGHVQSIALMNDLGFFSQDDVLPGMSARKATTAILNKALRLPDGLPKDIVVVRVTAVGTDASQQRIQRTFECIDTFNESQQLTAMMRTTAFPVSIVAQWLGSPADKPAGVFPPERVVPVGLVRQAMATRGIVVTDVTTPLPSAAGVK